MRLVAIPLLLAAVWLGHPDPARADSCATGDRAAGLRLAAPTATAGSALTALASFPGLEQTSVVVGPVSVTEVEADDVARLAPAPGVPAAPTRPKAHPARRPLERPAPMCTEGSDDPRCHPRAPGPGDGVDLDQRPLRTMGPPQPPIPGSDSVLADDPVPGHGLRAGTRSRVERPPRRG